MKKKILFINDEMTMGGVSRILNTLLKNLDQEKYDVDLLILHKHGELLDEIPEYVHVLEGSSFFDTIDCSIHQILKEKKLKLLFHKLRLLFFMKTGLIGHAIKKERKQILKSHYDIEFSAKEGFCTIFNSFGDSDLKLNWVQVDYEVNNYASHHMRLMKACLKRIDLNIACSTKVQQAFKKVFEIENVEVIHNLMDDKRIIDLSYENCSYPFENGFKCIAVARFHPQKSIDRLIYAVDYVKKKGVKINCTLIGGGELEESLKNQVSELGLDNDVCFMGYKTNPYNYIRGADLFVLSSLYEGYPTIVLESFLSGTPVLAMSVAGVNEQILHEYEGEIVDNDQNALNEALYALASNKQKVDSWKKQLSNYKSENEIVLKQLEGVFNGNK